LRSKADLNGRQYRLHRNDPLEALNQKMPISAYPMERRSALNRARLIALCGYNRLWCLSLALDQHDAPRATLLSPGMRGQP
jgi:hypothetical protein